MTQVSTPHYYHVCATSINKDDDGDDQALLYICKFETEKYLSPTEAVKYAQTYGEWKVEMFGGGEWSELDTALVEYSAPANSVHESWESIEPCFI